MMPLTPGAQIDELCRLLRESEQRRQAAETKLADRERHLGIAQRTIAEQRDLIASLTTELASLRGAIASAPHDDYVRDAARFFNVYAAAVPADARTGADARQVPERELPGILNVSAEGHPAKRSNLQVLAGRCGLATPGSHREVDA
jgi:hypothetical protein